MEDSPITFVGTSSKMLKHCIFADSILRVNYIQLYTAADCSFLRPFKNATLRMSY